MKRIYRSRRGPGRADVGPEAPPATHHMPTGSLRNGPVRPEFGARLVRATRWAGATLAAAGALVAVTGLVSAPRASAGESWSAPVAADTFNSLNSVSCTSATFCMAVDDQGNAVKYDGTSWSPTAADPGNDLTGVSCTSPTFCAAVDYSGNVLKYNGTSWSSPTTIDSGEQLTSVSCTSPTFCVAVDAAGHGVTYHGTLWLLSIADLAGDLTSVSCTSTTFCVAVDTTGRAVTSTGGLLWSLLPADIDGANDLPSVSCASASFCVAVDNAGNALTYNGAHWSSPAAIDTGSAPLSLSCTSATFCVAGDVSGNATIYDGTSWSTPNYVDDNVLVSLSCASTSFCVSVDDAGFAATYAGMNSATVTDVEFSGSPSAPVVTVSGSGFGTEANLGTPVAPGCAPQTGSDYGGNLWIRDSVGLGWAAGRGNACIGILISSYTDTQIVFTFGSDYSFYSLSSGDGFTFDLLGSFFAGTVSYSNDTQEASCQAGTTACSATVTAPSQTVAVTGTKGSTTTATITLSVATGVIACPSFGYAAPVTTLEDTGLTSGTSVTVTDMVSDLPSKKGVVICYQPVVSPPQPASFLSKCHGRSPVVPCYKSVTEAAGSVLATLVLPAGDPRFHVGGETPAVTGVSPTSPKAGKKLTIKGVNLSEVTAVTVGGVSAQILSRAPTSVKVIAPTGAHGGVVVTSLAGRASSPIVVTVAAATTHAGRAQRHG